MKVLLLAVCFLIPSSQQQGIPAPGVDEYDPARYDCPDGWEYFSDAQSCYLFNNTKISYDDANLFCERYYAELVSVNSASEHVFITAYLKRMDFSFLEWYTSGMKVANDSAPQGYVLMWLGDGTPVPDDPSYWYSTLGRDSIGDVVIYRTEYGDKWGFWMAYRDRPRAFICEMTVDNVYRYIKFRRDFDYGEKPIEPLRVPQGPQLFIWPDRFSYYLQPLLLNANDVLIQQQVTSFVAMECLATGYPLPLYKWRFYRSTSTPYVYVNASSRVVQMGGKIIIYDVDQMRDFGLYQCEAYNSYGTVVSPITELSLAQLNDFPANQIAPYRAPRRQALIVNCPSTTVAPSGTYTWYKESPLNFMSNERKSHVFVSQDGTMYFSSVQDADDGNYYCQITLNVGQSIDQTRAVISQAVRIQVTEGGTGEKKVPIIFEKFPKSFPSAPKRGDTVRFECVGQGTGFMYYHWFRQDELRFSSRTRFNDPYNRTFMIFDVQDDDQGTYICEVRSLSGEKVQRGYLLTVSSFPYFLIPVRNEHIDIGDKVTLRCQAGGTPPMTYSWLRNGKLFAQQGVFLQKDLVVDTKRYKLGGSGNILSITQLEIDDRGMYQCQASNSFWSAMSTAQLRVLEFAPSFLKQPLPPRVLGTTMGQVLIQCRPEGAPLPTIVWYFNGQQLNPSTDINARMRLLRDNSLLMRTLGAGDSGFYLCRASNSFGSDDNITQLTVLENTRIDVAPVSQQVAVGQNVTFKCKGWTALEFDLTYVWYKNGRKIVFENETGNYARGLGDNWGDITVIYADYADEGQYTCTAMTVSDQVSRSAQLTLIGPPGPPAALRALVRDTSLYIEWERPADHGQPVTTYSIEAEFPEQRPGRFVLLANVTAANWTVVDDTVSVTLRNMHVKPFVRFRLRSFAYNALGKSLSSGSTKSLLALPADVPPFPPQNISGGGGQIGTLEVTWNPLSREDWADAVIWYDIRFKEQGAPENAWQNYMQQYARGLAGRFVAFVGADKFYLPYEVQIRSGNSRGVSAWSNSTVIMSAAALPLVYPTRVYPMSYNESAMMIQWDPVEDTRQSMRGKLLGYRINYRRSDIVSENTNNLMDKRRTVLCPPASEQPKCLVNQGMIVGLLPEIFYWISVMSFNEAGNSLRSEEQLGNPLRLAPYQPVTEVFIFPYSTTSIQIRWRGVQTGGLEEALLGYKVKYWRDGQSMLDSTDIDCGKSVNMILTGLDPDVTYNVRVYGYSRGGQGRMSSPDVRFLIDSYGRLIELQGYRPNDGVRLGDARLAVLSLLAVAVAAARRR